MELTLTIGLQLANERECAVVVRMGHVGRGAERRLEHLGVGVRVGIRVRGEVKSTLGVSGQG